MITISGEAPGETSPERPSGEAASSSSSLWCSQLNQHQEDYDDEERFITHQ